MSSQPGFTRKLFWVSLSSILLVIFTFWLQYFPFTRGDELDFLKWAAIWKHNIFNSDEKPLKDSVVFIDVSHDLSLIPFPAAGYDSFPPYRGPEQVITDRSKLAKLFHIINSHPGGCRYILLDISLEDSTKEDPGLKAEIEHTANLITTAVLGDDDSSLVKPIFNIPWGVVSYTPLNQSKFYKMPVLYRDSLESLPAKMAEDVTGQRIESRHGLVFLNNKLSFNSVIPEFFWRPDDLNRSGDSGRNTFFLGELLILGDDAFAALRKKYVVIGNFSDDTHSTYLGKMAGSLILWDTFLTLRNKEIVVSLWWVLTLLVIFWLVSYKAIVHAGYKIADKFSGIKFGYVRKFIIKYVSYLGVVILIDIISYFFFGTFISLFFVATYFTFLEMISEHYREWFSKAGRIWKRLFSLLALAALTAHAHAQDYTVTHVRGNVLYRGHSLKVGDKVAGADSLTSNDHLAEIGLLHPLKGRVGASFASGKMTKVRDKGKVSELYSLTLDEWVRNYTTSRALTHKGQFDIAEFFADTSDGNSPFRILLIKGQSLPCVSNRLKILPADRFYICAINGDTSCVELARKNDSLRIPQDFAANRGIIKFGYNFGGSDKERYFPVSFQLNILSETELRKIIDSFHSNLQAVYKGDTEKMRDDIFDELTYYYGRFYPGTIESLIAR